LETETKYAVELNKICSKVKQNVSYFNTYLSVCMIHYPTSCFLSLHDPVLQIWRLCLLSFCLEYGD